MNDAIAIKGTYIIQDALTGEILLEKCNLIMDNLKQNFLKMLNYSEEGSVEPSSYFDLKYLAVGTGTTAPNVTDTTLETETNRKIYTTKSITGDKIEVIWSLTPSEFVGTFTEAGVFANGTAVADTGDLMSRVLISIVKNATQTLNVIYRLELI